MAPIHLILLRLLPGAVRFGTTAWAGATLRVMSDRPFDVDQGQPIRVMVDRYAKSGDGAFAAAASGIEPCRPRGNVVSLSSYVFATVGERKKA